MPLLFLTYLVLDLKRNKAYVVCKRIKMRVLFLSEVGTHGILGSSTWSTWGCFFLLFAESLGCSCINCIHSPFLFIQVTKSSNYIYTYFLTLLYELEFVLLLRYDIAPLSFAQFCLDAYVRQMLYVVSENIPTMKLLYSVL